MPEVAYLPDGVPVDSDVLNFLRPAAGSPITPPYGFKELFKNFADQVTLSQTRNLGIPLSPDGNWRLVYDASVPLVPKVKIVVNNLTIFSIDGAGNIIAAGLITAEETP